MRKPSESLNPSKTRTKHFEIIDQCILLNISSRKQHKAQFTDTHTWYVQVLRSPKEAFAAAMQSWRERCEKCVCLQGDYVEK